MIKKLFIAGLLILNIGMYGMGKEQKAALGPCFYPTFYPTRLTQTHRDQDHSTITNSYEFRHSAQAHNYKALLDEDAKHYLRLEEARIIALVVKSLKTGTGTRFSQSLAPYYINEETKIWLERLDYQEKIRRDLQRARKQAISKMEQAKN